MALFKILKGPEAALPTTKKEGWAYVTNEGNFYVDISDSLRVKINQNADYATKATNDSANQKITDTYIKDVIYNQSGTAPYYTLRLGNGNLKATNGTTDKVTIPVANTDDAGVVTTGEQFFAGAKTFNALITAKSGLASDENITTQKQLVSTIADGTAPLAVSSTTLVTNLNADTVDGLHASNNLFNATNSSTTILPTQRAIWSSLNDLLVAAHALVYRGLIDPTNSSTHPDNNNVGDLYVISNQGNFAGVYCEPGDLAIYYTSGWDIVQTNINGAVVIKGGGAYNTAHTTANAIARFDDTTGRVIKNSAVTIDNSGHIIPAVNDTQNLGSKDFVWNTIYGTAFTGLANQATHDDAGQVIQNTYIKEIVYVQDDDVKSGSEASPYLRYKYGHGKDPVYLAIPTAGAQKGGILTSGAQEISGAKTLNATDGSLTIPKADSFIYSGIQSDSAAGTAKYVWFSTTGGIPKYNTKFAFNPSCTTKWDSYDGTTVTAYTQLTVDRLFGIAFKALQDDSGQNINDTYIKNIEFVKDNATIAGSLSNPYLRFFVGNGNATNLAIPPATATGGGILTAAAQEIGGAKTLNKDTGSLTIPKANGFTYSGIQADTAAGTTKYVWFSTTGGVPKYNTKFAFDPACTTAWASFDTGTTATAYTQLTVDRVNGIAFKALQDDSGQNINDTYIKAIEFIVDNETQAGSVSNPYLKYTLGNGADITKIALPAASASQGGILNADAQEIKGKKTFNDGIAAKLTSTDADVTHYLWFSTINTATGIGTPVYDTGLTYNAKSGILTTATFKGALDGLAAQATADAKNQNIADTYIKDIEYSNYSFTVKLGSGTTLKTISPAFAASDTCGGDAKKAKTWSNSLKLELVGEVTGSATFDGDEGTVKLTTALANSNLTALDGRYIRKDQADGTAYTLTLNNTTDLNSTNISTAQGALIVKGAVHVAKQIYASKVHNAVWNDYAECRKAETIEPGRVVIEHESGEMKVSSERLQAGGSIISDTYGSCMGETAECKTPIAVAGRVLVYTYEDRNTYPLGAAVCTAPNGTVSVMTREEIREYPERILGTVSEIPDYEVWGTGNIQVNNRIWIKVR